MFFHIWTDIGEAVAGIVGTLMILRHNANYILTNSEFRWNRLLTSAIGRYIWHFSDLLRSPSQDLESYDA